MTHWLTWLAIVFAPMGAFAVLLVDGVAGLVHPFDFRSAEQAPEPSKVVSAHVFFVAGLSFAVLAGISAVVDLVT